MSNESFSGDIVQDVWVLHDNQTGEVLVDLTQDEEFILQILFEAGQQAKAESRFLTMDSESMAEHASIGYSENYTPTQIAKLAQTLATKTRHPLSEDESESFNVNPVIVTTNGAIGVEIGRYSWVHPTFEEYFGDALFEQEEQQTEQTSIEEKSEPEDVVLLIDPISGAVLRTESTEVSRLTKLEIEVLSRLKRDSWIATAGMRDLLRDIESHIGADEVSSTLKDLASAGFVIKKQTKRGRKQYALAPAVQFIE